MLTGRWARDPGPETRSLQDIPPLGLTDLAPTMQVDPDSPIPRAHIPGIQTGMAHFTLASLI